MTGASLRRRLCGDRFFIYLAAFLRAVATGMVGIVLGLYFAHLAYTPEAMGAIVSAGLWGGALGALLVTLRGDAWGRRASLIALGLLSAGGAAYAVFVADGAAAVGAAAFVGMLNGQGRDRGALLVLEQSMLPATTDDAGRTRVFAWYNVLLDAGHGIGALLAGLPALLHEQAAVAEGTALRGMLGIYVVLIIAGVLAYTRLTPATETAAPAARLTAASRTVLGRISLLFAIDSVAGGFLGAALLTYFFRLHFAASDGAIALLFFAARIMNALSHLGAAWLARRIGLVRTMVFTHVPSSLLLLTVPIAPSFAVAALLFLLREGLVEMDVPTRQSYVMAVVRPEERTVASGVTHLVRLAGWAAGPVLAGWMMQAVALGAPLIVGAAMKIAYDLLLYLSFRKLKPPEEASGSPRA